MREDQFGDIAKRLAAGAGGRSEATIQSDVRALIQLLPRGLSEQDFIADLEVPVPGGGRLDLRVDDLIIEVKQSLGNEAKFVAAKFQVERYLVAVQAVLDGARVALLTDGQVWIELSLDAAGSIEERSKISAPEWLQDPEVLEIWLLAVYDRAHATTIPATAENVVRLLGSEATAHAHARQRLVDMHAACRSDSEVRLKRELWAKLLTVALGTNFDNDDELFVDHTMLVVIAELIAHAVLGFDITRPDLDARTLVDGSHFRESGVRGVVESDFFDWPVDVDGGVDWMRSLARRVARLDWGSGVEHDVLKALYEAIITPDLRRSLGEYYTPDWLAERIVADVVDEPLTQRVHDPSCGSGTFIFHAVRRHLAAADAAGIDPAAAMTSATELVSGIDVHPVAVTLARVTYLLAIGPERMRSHRPDDLAIPVHLGDSVQWRQDTSLLRARDLVVETGDGLSLLASDLRFPMTLIADVETFDRIVAEMAHRANDPARSPGDYPSIRSLLSPLKLDDADRETLETTFIELCKLVDSGRDHIWGYYVRNLARPLRMSLEEHRVDRLVGNPPWLTFNIMTNDMKESMRTMAQDRGLWKGTARNHDLSALFVARAVELYLRNGGRFGFVMPESTLNRKHMSGFRTGEWSAKTAPFGVQLDQPWDFADVEPSIFPVPSCVVRGKRAATYKSLPGTKLVVSGKLDRVTCTWAEAEPRLQWNEQPNVIAGEFASPYSKRFEAGAKLDPRVLVLVERVADTPSGGVLGPRVGTHRVRSRRTAAEKVPWRDVPSLEASVEDKFVVETMLGESIGAFCCFAPQLAVVPWSDGALHGSDSDVAEANPGLRAWQRQTESTWAKHRRNEAQPWLDRLDWQTRLSRQLAAVRDHLVVYAKSGSNLTAARAPHGALVDQQLYWSACRSADEARYLTAVFNAPLTTTRTAPFQSKGQFGTRHFDKYAFQLPIPEFDAEKSLHQRLIELCDESEAIAWAVDLEGFGWQKRRSLLRAALTDSGMFARLDGAVAELLG